METHTFAIVTGAASGMGRCYAIQLAEKGYAVLLVDINDEALQELSCTISRDFDVPAPTLCADLSEPSSARRIVDLCKEKGWEVEILVNNAGMLITTPIAETEAERLQRIIALHCTTPLLLCSQVFAIPGQTMPSYILKSPSEV